jgi:hypothetical protein
MNSSRRCGGVSGQDPSDPGGAHSDRSMVADPSRFRPPTSIFRFEGDSFRDLRGQAPRFKSRRAPFSPSQALWRSN